MRILKAFTFVAVAGALVAGAAQAQLPTATGSAWLTGVNGSYWNYVAPPIGEYTAPYFMRFQIPTLPTNQMLLPPAGTSTWGPTTDIFCVDLYNNIGIGDQYRANFTNLTNTAAIGVATRLRTLTQYLEAAYLAEKIELGANKNLYTGAIWNIMTGNPVTYAVSGDIQLVVADAVANYGSVVASQWVVVTDVNAAGSNTGGKQEFLTHVTPEPATLLLLGTGLIATLMAAGAFRRSAV